MIKHLSYINATDIFPRSLYNIYILFMILDATSEYNLDTLNSIFRDTFKMDVVDFIALDKSQLLSNENILDFFDANSVNINDVIDDIMIMQNNILEIKSLIAIDSWPFILVDMEH